ncbi:unnamed protein product, partial [Cyprideis torosa]
MDRKRSSKFSAGEKRVLLEIISKFPVIGNRRNDQKTCEKKQEAWCQVHQEFNLNSEAQFSRPLKSLKCQWKNIKFQRKKGEEKKISNGGEHASAGWNKMVAGQLNHTILDETTQEPDSSSYIATAADKNEENEDGDIVSPPKIQQQQHYETMEKDLNQQILKKELEVLELKKQLLAKKILFQKIREELLLKQWMKFGGLAMMGMNLAMNPIPRTVGSEGFINGMCQHRREVSSYPGLFDPTLQSGGPIDLLLFPIELRLLYVIWGLFLAVTFIVDLAWDTWRRSKEEDAREREAELRIKRGSTDNARRDIERDRSPSRRMSCANPYPSSPRPSTISTIMPLELRRPTSEGKNLLMFGMLNQCSNISSAASETGLSGSRNHLLIPGVYGADAGTSAGDKPKIKITDENDCSYSVTTSGGDPAALRSSRNSICSDRRVSQVDVSSPMLRQVPPARRRSAVPSPTSPVAYAGADRNYKKRLSDVSAISAFQRELGDNSVRTLEGGLQARIRRNSAFPMNNAGAATAAKYLVAPQEPRRRANSSPNITSREQQLVVSQAPPCNVHRNLVAGPTPLRTSPPGNNSW